MMKAESSNRANPVALVTGSRSGLGAALAAELRRRNCRVIGVGRQPGDEAGSPDFITADLSDPAAPELIARELARREVTTLDYLVNNAGFGGYALTTELPEADLRRMFEVDFFAPVALCRALDAWLCPGRSRVINISSIAALAPVVCMSAYCAAKAAWGVYSQTLRMELAQRKITVLTVYPGRISTGFSSRAVALRQHPATPGTQIPPERFARAVLRASDRRRGTLIFPGWYRWFAWFTRCCPDFYARLCRRAWRLEGAK